MRWYALHVRSRHEKAVHAQLEAKQQDVLLPLYSVKSRRRDGWRTVSLPLFPGYVFCRFDVSARYPVLATSGVIDIVRLGSEPAPVENSEIEAIQLVVKSAVAAEPHPHLVQGQRVMMAGGPLNGLTGTLAQIRNSLRLVVCVELLCRSVLVEIDRELVIPYQPSKPAYPQIFDCHSKTA
jgi:transcription antitermination factor NusG